MNTLRYKSWIFFLCWSVAAGCGPSSGDPSTETVRVADAYAALMLLHEQYRSQDRDRDSLLYHRQVQSLLDSTGFSREEFSAAVDRQLRTLESSRLFYERLYTALELRRNKP